MGRQRCSLGLSQLRRRSAARVVVGYSIHDTFTALVPTFAHSEGQLRRLLWPLGGCCCGSSSEATKPPRDGVTSLAQRFSAPPQKEYRLFQISRRHEGLLLKESHTTTYYRHSLQQKKGSHSRVGIGIQECTSDSAPSNRLFLKFIE